MSVLYNLVFGHLNIKKTSKTVIWYGCEAQQFKTHRFNNPGLDKLYDKTIQFFVDRE